MTTPSASLQSQIRSVLSEVLGVPAASISAASSPATIDAWDSVQHLSIVMALEQACGVQFEPEDIEKMKTVGDIESIVARKQG
jgi:acyl carrier protein